MYSSLYAWTRNQALSHALHHFGPLGMLYVVWMEPKCVYEV